jgi:hypothetical protein
MEEEEEEEKEEVVVVVVVEYMMNRKKGRTENKQARKYANNHPKKNTLSISCSYSTRFFYA